MLTVREKEELRLEVGAWKRAGERVALVPTMGALHDGHLSLVQLAKKKADRVVVSIFVNPTQFGPGEDFETYPRVRQHDASLLRKEDCDLLFIPEVETLYPAGSGTRVEVAGFAENLEAACRPGHFTGVATVVTLLFSLVRPDVAVFGEKDAQQLAVVRRLTRDLHLPIEIVGGPTVRDRDGLALSSRNAYLDPEERRAAKVLYRCLEAAFETVAGGERRPEEIRRTMRRVLDEEPRARVEYAEVVHADSFAPISEREAARGKIVLPVAVRIGSTRLIDNLHLDLPDRPLAVHPNPTRDLSDPNQDVPDHDAAG